MYKKTLILSLALFALSAPAALAITTTPSITQTPIKTRIENRKLAAENIQEQKIAQREEFKMHREEFIQQLNTLKDTRKKLVVEHIDEKLTMINENRTDQMTKSLDQMSKLLEKFKTRAANLKQDGQDTTVIDVQVTEAEKAILDARAAVTAQAEKDYAADLSNESALKNKVGQAMKALQQDLKSTREIVKAAKKEVMDVARALAKLSGEKPTPSITSTPSPTITVTLTPTPTL